MAAFIKQKICRNVEEQVHINQHNINWLKEQLESIIPEVHDVDYETEVKNKPQINGHEISGNKTGTQLGLVDLTTLGDVADLDTTSKEIVGAINEVLDTIPTEYIVSIDTSTYGFLKWKLPNGMTTTWRVPTPTDMMDLSTAQVVTGRKTFRGNNLLRIQNPDNTEFYIDFSHDVLRRYHPTLGTTTNFWPQKNGVIATEYTAGVGISISADNVISATGTSVIDYNNAINKPQINGYELSGNKSGEQLGLVSSTALNAYQQKVSAELQTKSNYIVGAINELNARQSGEIAYVYELTLDPATGTVTIENENLYADIVKHKQQYGHYPRILGSVVVSGVATAYDAEFICYEATSTQLKLTGSIEKSTASGIEKDLIVITTTSTTQSGTYEAVGLLSVNAPRVTRIYISNDILNLEASDHSIVSYRPTIRLSDIQNLITGTKFISVDVAESGNTLDISFDFTDLDEFITFPEIQTDVILGWTEDSPSKLYATLNQAVSNRINNSLQLPLVHTEETLVGVDTAGGQEQIKIGSGLSVVNGALTNGITATETLVFTMVDDTEVTVEAYVKEN